MQILKDAPQGSTAWHVARQQHFCASEAPSMMSVSPYTTRSALLHQKATGLVPEVSVHMQARFDAGHADEKARLTNAKAIVGEELYPVVGTAMLHGLPLLASLDGCTMDDSAIWENKLGNADTAKHIELFGEPPEHHVWQLEHQLLVSGADRVLFTCGDAHCWYQSQPKRRAQLVAGWKQFQTDLLAYEPSTAPTVEKIVAESVEALPAPVVQVSGELALTDNFKLFEEKLRHFLEHRLIRAPKTDEDFVNLDAQIKAMKQGREALKAAKTQMLAQVQPVDQANKTAEMLDTLLQQNCSMAERLLKDEKERRRGEIVAAGISALRAHVASLNVRLGKPLMPAMAADFGGCVKGLKSLSSMEEKVSGEMARMKIESNAIADRIQANLSYLAEDVPQGHAFLFADLQALVLKASDDFRAVVDGRIAAHKAKREQEEADQRERIRQEELQRIAREQEAEQRRVAAEEQARAAVQVAAAAPPPVAAPVAPVAVVARPIAKPAETAKAVDTPPTLTLGQIGTRLGFNLTADFIRTLGFDPAARARGAVLYHEESFDPICEALVAHVQSIQALQAA